MIGLFIVTFLDLLVSFAVIIEQLLNNNKPAGKNNTRILLTYQTVTVVCKLQHKVSIHHNYMYNVMGQMTNYT